MDISSFIVDLFPSSLTTIAPAIAQFTRESIMLWSRSGFMVERGANEHVGMSGVATAIEIFSLKLSNWK